MISYFSYVFIIFRDLGPIFQVLQQSIRER